FLLGLPGLTFNPARGTARLRLTRLLEVTKMRILILATAIVLGLAGTAAASGPDGALLARLMAAGDHDGARAHLAATLSAPTLHALHRTHLEGLIARQQGRHADAVSLFRAALVIDPGFVPARIELARTLLALRNFEGARYQVEILALTEIGRASCRGA